MRFPKAMVYEFERGEQGQSTYFNEVKECLEWQQEQKWRVEIKTILPNKRKESVVPEHNK